MDIIAGHSRLMTADARPIHTIWTKAEVIEVKKAHRRRSRRTYKQYLKTGRIEDFNRSQKLLTNWDFD